ncbi:Conserved thioredoxin-like protein, related [Eimeria acervulina]|uniref:Conserved thioredoxin-like protein, related n=1 Tax=Eimeria acervulina TaxID=5801 RepID=U6GM29_EIMAC|nr:Conserved thioredoxin-like protein, related [Eimeria acervulina]CDI79659.1 Conserved thioredoxin-like protein, related [Eimeria acervulina]
MSSGGAQNSLLKLLDLSQCECRNEAAANSLLGLLQNQEKKTESAAVLESGNEDPQLFISVGFSVPVRLTGLRLQTPKGAVAAGEAPRRLQTDPATDEFVGHMAAERRRRSLRDRQKELPEDESLEAGLTLPLKSVRYKGVASLQVFVADNGGAPVTKISQLEVYGTPVDSLQMKDWKPLKPEESLAQNDT